MTTSASAFAGGAVWHWEKFGTGGYRGVVQINDGGLLNYQRYDSSGSPALFGSTSVQSPVTVIAGADIEVDIVRAGVAQDKKNCGGGTTWKAYVTPVTACYNGVSHNLAGIHAWAQDTSATKYTPRLSVYVQGRGWQAVNNNACGNVQTIQVCEK
ncbi:hypothetical protein [Stutzerimonas stutzeri]|uniref:hypothetical protein n=1 Tax=Stutzerimonas stutzeri TaxID=316 RepID=UPI00265CD888|nr:hypothetical protein [Stutzerimonas stutzeri]MCF6783447.1 hypothetical protein [Stutzerimonas stutzeri]